MDQLIARVSKEPAEAAARGRLLAAASEILSTVHTMQTTTTPRRSFAGGLYTRGALLGFHERGLDAAAAKAVRASEGWSRQEVSACVDLPLPEL